MTEEQYTALLQEIIRFNAVLERLVETLRAWDRDGMPAGRVAA